MPARDLAAIVLAAGEGTRMRSTRPKPLHLLCGRAMLLYVLDSLRETEARKAVVVVGHGADRVTKKLGEQDTPVPLEFVEQAQQRGTGDAVSVALTGFEESELDDEGDVLVLPGDHPLLRPATISALVEQHRATDAACTILTARLDDPTGYGRVLRDANDRVVGIVEQADATPEQLAITEINTSIYCFRSAVLAPALRRIDPDNAQGEYYLTDVVSVLVDAGYAVSAMVAADASETEGVNDRAQLAAAEAELRRRTNEAWLRRGVAMVDPGCTYVDATVELAPDVTLFPGAILSGRTTVGRGTEIGPGVRLVDCTVGEECVVAATTGREASIGDRCEVGPYAALGPGADIPDDTVTGPFYTAGIDVAASEGNP
ncbi:MAG: NTP transferase domain-containing protein [Acidimicrobiia bacterium]|nr:NTP transferase domain-containing protein [Acidimicrobiia bacterium]